ncbi:uncharacterized protein VTP21DRAFT_3828 [Calcarisporiella thermophila]|uniref:uncharacterized protein n=1 Tax=Calcarisporiella thermophila TaxID=911321 RepID=UPI0037421C33
MDSGERRLRELGYKQELKRELTTFSNYAVSLSIVCISSGLTSLFQYGMRTGGPVVIIFGWIISSIMTLSVALSMAEICSSFPTSGGLYFWAYYLASPKYAPVSAFFTGYFNLLGQFAVSASIDFGLALMLGGTISSVVDTFVPTPPIIIALHFAIVASHCIMNSLGMKVLRVLNDISGVWQAVAPFVVVVTVLVFSRNNLRDAEFVFTHFENQTGFASSAYVALIGVLMAQYTLTGYDASAHMTEETKRADVAGPVGMILAVLVSFLVGLFFLIGLLFSVQDYNSVLNTRTNFPVTQILLDATGPTGTIILMTLLIVACWFCGLASITANSRMIYAFSRDGALPASKIWHRLGSNGIPLNAVFLSSFVAFILALPYLGNSTAYGAVTSVATIGLYLSYGSPILCKVLFRRFTPGAFRLPFSTLINTIALLWIAFITVLFVLPQVNPVTAESMNYASVAVGALTIGTLLGWVFDAHRWFKGPVANIEPEETLESDSPFKVTMSAVPTDEKNLA